MDEMQYQVDLLRAMNEKLQDSEKKYHLISDSFDYAFIYWNMLSGKVEVEGNWSKYFSFPFSSVKDIERIYEQIEPEDAVALREILTDEDANTKSVVCKLINERKWYCFKVSISKNESGVVTHKVVCISDETKSKFQSDELTYMAFYDGLTGLYNRNYFVHQLSDWLEKAKDDYSIISVMLIDIDEFRKINDSFGLIVGDELVQVFGQYLKEYTSENIIISRFSSDLFCMAIYNPCGNRSVDYIATAIQNRVQRPFLLSSKHELIITVSMGVAEFPEAAESALDLINFAEIAMFKAKGFGKDSMQYFNAPILHEFLKNVSIERKLQEAVLMKRFMLFFQPQYDSLSNELRGVEALIRWKDNEGNMISPSVFIPIAEKNGTIIPIGDWVLEESISIFAGWLKKYNRPLILSINISAIQFKREEFIPHLLQLLKQHDVKSELIELEITESVLIDDFSDVIDKMHFLRDCGIRVSLDDFGTGYSSLSYLKGLPIDTLKIDKSFIDTVAKDEPTKIITESIINMVKQLGFETVAEGVETEEQYEYLKKIQCDNIQGFFLGRPMQQSAIEELLMKEL